MGTRAVCGRSVPSHIASQEGADLQLTLTDNRTIVVETNSCKTRHWLALHSVSCCLLQFSPCSNGKNTLVIHNTCEDSLLAAPIILDLVLLAELITRIEFKAEGEEQFHGFNPIAALLSYLTKVRLHAPASCF